MSLTSAQIRSEIRTAHKANIKPDTFRAKLIKRGVPKGTASKAVTIYVNLHNGNIELGEFTSLSGGYTLCQSLKKTQDALHAYELDNNDQHPLVRVVLDAGWVSVNRP